MTVSTQIYGKSQWEDKNSKSYLDQMSQMPVVLQKPLALHWRWHQGGQGARGKPLCILERELSEVYYGGDALALAKPS